MKLFTTPEPLKILKQFTADIEKIGVEIRKRLVYWFFYTWLKSISAIRHGPSHTNIFYRRMSHAELTCELLIFTFL